MLEGETGTGKELLAEALHRMGGRRNGPFVVFDCASVAPALVEATLPAALAISDATLSPLDPAERRTFLQLLQRMAFA